MNRFLKNSLKVAMIASTFLFCNGVNAETIERFKSGTNLYTAGELVKNVIGDLEASNVKRKGTIYVAKDITSDFKMESAVILDTSGKDDGASENDSDLAKLMGNYSYGGHTSSLEFEMVANGKLLNFNYLFGSAEFDQAPMYNDVFGLFVSVNGGEYENIALIEKSDKTMVPVNITNLRAGLSGTEMENGSSTDLNTYNVHTLFTGYPSFKVIPEIEEDNLSTAIIEIHESIGNFPIEDHMDEEYYEYLKSEYGLTETYEQFISAYKKFDFSTVSEMLKYNGITKILTAKKKVEIGDKVKIKFVIADVSDDGVDSFVAIEAGSLSFDAQVDYNKSVIKDLSPNTLYNIKDGNNNYEVTSDNEGHIKIAGTDKNGKKYNFFGKTIELNIKGSSETETVKIKAPTNGSVKEDFIGGLKENSIYEVKVEDKTYEIKSNSNGEIRLSGIDENGNKYNFYGKKISIHRKGDNDTFPLSIDVGKYSDIEESPKTDEKKETEEKNPQTFDKIYGYISLLTVSGMGLVLIRKLKK